MHETQSKYFAGSYIEGGLDTILNALNYTDELVNTDPDLAVRLNPLKPGVGRKALVPLNFGNESVISEIVEAAFSWYPTYTFTFTADTILMDQLCTSPRLSTKPYWVVAYNLLHKLGPILNLL